MNYHKYQLDSLRGHIVTRDVKTCDLDATTPLMTNQIWLFLPHQHLS